MKLLERNSCRRIFEEQEELISHEKFFFAIQHCKNFELNFFDIFYGFTDIYDNAKTHSCFEGVFHSWDRFIVEKIHFCEVLSSSDY